MVSGVGADYLCRLYRDSLPHCLGPFSFPVPTALLLEVVLLPGYRGASWSCLLRPHSPLSPMGAGRDGTD